MTALPIGLLVGLLCGAVIRAWRLRSELDETYGDLMQARSVLYENNLDFEAEPMVRWVTRREFEKRPQHPITSPKHRPPIGSGSVLRSTRKPRTPHPKSIPPPVRLLTEEELLIQSMMDDLRDRTSKT